MGRGMMHLLAQSVVERVRNSIGERFDFVTAFDWIRNLDDLAKKIQSPPTVEAAAILDAPVVVSGVPFYRLSFAAGELISERFGTFSGRVYDMAVAWASAHARDVDATRRMLGLSAAEAEAEIVRWAATVPASFRAVVETVNALIAPADVEPAKKDSAEVGFGAVVSILVKECGHDATYWCFAPIAEVMMALDQVARQNEPVQRPGEPPSPSSYAAKAQIRFNRAARDFEAWAKETWPHE